MENVKVRNSSIELLRILAIIGVIILHYNNPMMGAAIDLTPKNSLNYYFLLLLECLCICAVNLFVLISGYFLSVTYKRSLLKPIQLIVEVIIINEAVYIASTVLSGDILNIEKIVRNLIPSNWFLILYSALYIISPYLNLVIEKLSTKKLKQCLIILLLLFAVYNSAVEITVEVTGMSMNGLSTVGAYGTQYGYNIVNFILMYFIGAYIRKTDLKVKTMKLLFVLLINILFIFAMYLVAPDAALSYCSIFVILEATTIFLIFKNIQIKPNKIINALAKGSFTVFLTHFLFLPYLKIDFFVNANILIMIAHILISTIGIYIAGWIIFFVYDKLTKPVYLLLAQKVKCLTYDISN